MTGLLLSYVLLFVTCYGRRGAATGRGAAEIPKSVHMPNIQAIGVLREAREAYRIIHFSSVWRAANKRLIHFPLPRYEVREIK
jgi:hypothetical protein